MTTTIGMDGPLKGGLGHMAHENQSLIPPSDDPSLKKDQGHGVDGEIEIDVDVKKLVRRYEENDVRDYGDELEKISRIADSNVKKDQPDNYIDVNENSDAFFENAEEQYENPTLQHDEDNSEPEYFEPIESAASDHSSAHTNQQSNKSPAPPDYEFDAAAAREASKLMWNAQRPTGPLVQSDGLPVVRAQELTASRNDDLERHDRKNANDYHSKNDSLPPVPGYDNGNSITAEKSNAVATAADERSLSSRTRARGHNFKDFAISKTKSKSNRIILILVASAVLIVIIAILFMIIYFTTANKSLPTVTTQATDVRPTDTGPIVIVGVDLDATVRLSNRAFIPQYNNDLSPQYRSLEMNFTNTMDAVFYGSDLGGVYNGTSVNGFSPGSVIVTFIIRLLSPPVIAPGDATTPSGSIDDQLKKIEEDVIAAVHDVIEDAADDGILDELGFDSESFVVTDVGLDVRVVTEAPTMPTTFMSSTMTTVSQSQSTHIPDTTQPIIACPDDNTVYLEAGQFSVNVTWPTLNATDDSGQVNITTDMDEGLWDAGEYTVVATATDPAGNSAKCSFNITVKARTCPAGWLKRSDSCYRLNSAPPGPYATALQVCLELDAIPVIPNTEAEYDFVINFLYDLGLQYIWLGCSDVTRERKFDCLDGTRIQSQNSWWGPGQPNLFETEDCVVLVLAARELQDFYCTFDQPRTLCEKVAD